MEDTDIIMQGPICDSTKGSVEEYLKLPFVSKIIVSTWNSDRDKVDFQESEKVKVVFSDPPNHDGGGNVNYQIISSMRGIKVSDAAIVIKMRTDQTIAHDDMISMNEFYLKNRTANGEIFVLGLMGADLPSHPYHPQDHVF